MTEAQAEQMEMAIEDAYPQATREGATDRTALKAARREIDANRDAWPDLTAQQRERAAQECAAWAREGLEATS